MSLVVGVCRRLLHVNIAGWLEERLIISETSVIDLILRVNLKQTIVSANIVSVLYNLAQYDC